jgi:uncharacterized protein
MKLGIISDTHIPVRASQLPSSVFAAFQGVDRILHAGDLESEKVLTELEAIAPVTAVAGNMDTSAHHLPLKREFQIEQHWIGLIHGAGGPRNQIREQIRHEFTKAKLIIYGHTHQPYWGEEGGIRFMNPGSPTDTFFAPYCSVGLIEIKNGDIHGEIIQL